MNAAERFFAASRAGDLDAVVAELAEDVILLTPRSDEPIVGRQAAGALLRAVEGACDEPVSATRRSAGGWRRARGRAPSRGRGGHPMSIFHEGQSIRHRLP